MTLGLGGKEGTVTTDVYTDILFVVFEQGPLLVLLVFSSLSFSTGFSTNEDKEDLQVSQLFLGSYVGGGGGEGWGDWGGVGGYPPPLLPISEFVGGFIGNGRENG